MNSLPLKDIIASILKEFESANIAVEISREYWRQFYESGLLLKEFTPSRIRVVEADISLPVAVEQVRKTKSKPLSLSHIQLLRLMPNHISIEEREIAAGKVISSLTKRRKQFFTNTNLAKDVCELLKRQFPSVDFDLVLKGLESLRQDFLSKPNIEWETRFIYRTEELEKITRFNFKIIVD